MRSSEELGLIASIADGLPCGVWVATAPEGRFVYSNRAFEEIMGMGPVADVGVGQYAIPYGIYGRDGNLYPEDRLPFVRAVQERTTVVVDDLVIHRRDGRRVYVRAFGKPMVDPSGDMTHVAIAFFDITREAEAQAQLARAERLASIGLLAAGVAHEVNNPLSFVIGNLDLMCTEIAHWLAERPDPALSALDGMARDARQGAQRVRTIVRDLKVFSRIREQHPGAVDVRAALEAAISMSKNETRHRARMEVDLAPVPPVVGEEGRLGQVFLNLLLNAAQSIPEGAAEKNMIRVTTRPDPGGGARIEVSDTGVGIEPGHLARIFDPFFTTKEHGVGTGLGLSICHGAVTDLGGRIEVESAPGRGTTFRVILPRAPSATEAPTTGPAPANPGRSRTNRRASVLVIDDEPLIIKLVAAILAQDYDVTCETRADAALARIESGERFDAILCDLMMPQVTGMDLHDSLLEIAPDQARGMLFLTGGAFTSRARAFLERASNVTIDKPFDAAALKARVRQLIG